MRLGFTGLINISIIAAHCWLQIKLSEIVKYKLRNTPENAVDRGHTDRVTTATQAGFRRRWRPRPRHAARLTALARMSQWKPTTTATNPYLSIHTLALTP